VISTRAEKCCQNGVGGGYLLSKLGKRKRLVPHVCDQCKGLHAFDAHAHTHTHTHHAHTHTHTQVVRAAVAQCMPPQCKQALGGMLERTRDVSPEVRLPA